MSRHRCCVQRVLTSARWTNTLAEFCSHSHAAIVSEMFFHFVCWGATSTRRDAVSDRESTPSFWHFSVGLVSLDSSHCLSQQLPLYKEDLANGVGFMLSFANHEPVLTSILPFGSCAPKTGCGSEKQGILHAFAEATAAGWAVGCDSRKHRGFCKVAKLDKQNCSIGTHEG